MKLKLALVLLLLPYSAHAEWRADAWTNSVPCPLLEVPNLDHVLRIPGPDNLPEITEITSAYYSASYNWVSPYVYMDVGTGDIMGGLPVGVLFGESQTFLDGRTAEDIYFRLNVREPDDPPPPVTEQLVYHPMWPGQCSVTVNYIGWSDEVTGPTPEERRIRAAALQSVYLLLLGD